MNKLSLLGLSMILAKSLVSGAKPYKYPIIRGN